MSYPEPAPEQSQLARSGSAARARDALRGGEARVPTVSRYVRFYCALRAPHKFVNPIKSSSRDAIIGPRRGNRSPESAALARHRPSSPSLWRHPLSLFSPSLFIGESSGDLYSRAANRRATLANFSARQESLSVTRRLSRSDRSLVVQSSLADKD